MIHDSNYYKNLGSKINKLRKQKGFTQEELSYISDVERSKISRIENGSEDFYFSTLLKIAKALETTPKELLDF